MFLGEKKRWAGIPNWLSVCCFLASVFTARTLGRRLWAA